MIPARPFPGCAHWRSYLARAGVETSVSSWSVAPPQRFSLENRSSLTESNAGNHTGLSDPREVTSDVYPSQIPDWTVQTRTAPIVQNPCPAPSRFVNKLSKFKTLRKKASRAFKETEFFNLYTKMDVTLPALPPVKTQKEVEEEEALAPTLQSAQESIGLQIETVSKLATVASKYPYYRYNGMWSRDLQNTVRTLMHKCRPIARGADGDKCFAIVLCGWLGGYPPTGDESRPGRLLALEEVGGILDVPVNLKDRDAFHLTIEEYLQSLVSLIEELARLAVNSVTLGDYQRPLLISRFVKDLHAGFQILNLKNDSLRRRTDSIKYQVKKVEDVVYDLSLRNLVPQPE
ncbi:MAG: hypothetical protein M1826_002083 [Phylliscum demangeonii]|nr:MAG: hypothetical protein M1826_002083 [Phylliscum demangeonii]